MLSLKILTILNIYNMKEENVIPNVFYGNNRIFPGVVYIHVYVLITVNRVTINVIRFSLKKEIQLKNS